MAFKDRLKEARISCGLTQEQVAEKIGVAKSTFTGYERGNSEPSMMIISKIMKALDIDANFLWQDEINALGGNPIQLPYNELQHIKKYRKLSPYQQGTIDLNIDRMLNEPTPVQSVSDVLPITCYQRIASAGRGEYLFDDIPSEIIYVPNTETARHADFVVGVQGDSMEPDYHDGDQVFVQKSDEISVGSVGIFVKGENCFIKEMGTDRLISLNKKYPDIIPDEEIRLIGKVIGKVED